MPTLTPDELEEAFAPKPEPVPPPKPAPAKIHKWNDSLEETRPDASITWRQAVASSAIQPPSPGFRTWRCELSALTQS